MKRAFETCTVDIGGRCIDINILCNPRARRIILRVDAWPGAVTLVTPHHTGRARALLFVHENQQWLQAKLAQQPRPVPFVAAAQIPLQGSPHTLLAMPEARGAVLCQQNTIQVPGGAAHMPRRLTEWLKAEARSAITAAVQEHAAAFERTPGRISIRDQKSRWGSCSPDGNMSFSWRLILAPPEILDYVCAHEAAHLVHMNHGRNFWKLVRRRVADPAAAARWLNQNGPGLHRYGMAAKNSITGNNPVMPATQNPGVAQYSPSFLDSAEPVLPA